MEGVVEAELILLFTLLSMGTMPVTEPVNLLSSSQSTDSATPLDRPGVSADHSEEADTNKEEYEVDDKRGAFEFGKEDAIFLLDSRLHKVNDLIAKNSMCI